MQRLRIYIVPILIITLFVSACNRSDETSKSIDAEHISYQVNYMENMAGDIPTRMLPDVMEAYYTKKYVMTSIKGFLGQFSLVQVANLRHDNVITMMNFLGTKV